MKEYISTSRAKYNTDLRSKKLKKKKEKKMRQDEDSKHCTIYSCLNAKMAQYLDKCLQYHVKEGNNRRKEVIPIHILE